MPAALEERLGNSIVVARADPPMLRRMPCLRHTLAKAAVLCCAPMGVEDDAVGPAAGGSRGHLDRIGDQRGAPELLDPLFTAKWAEPYGRPVHLCSRPRHPITQLTAVAATHLTGQPYPHSKRCSLPQQYFVDARRRVPPRTDKDGLPARRHTRWSGYLLHITETCTSPPVTWRVRSGVGSTVSYPPP